MPGLERPEDLVLAQIGELLPEALEVPEGVVVDEADQPEKFEQRVLERGSREQELR